MCGGSVQAPQAPIWLSCADAVTTWGRSKAPPELKFRFKAPPQSSALPVTAAAAHCLIFSVTSATLT
eukprot:scaffold58121_cov74-Phaeocystis_antarctica.AAC.1